MERIKPSPGKVISGTHGYFWWNNDICYEVTSFEAKLRQMVKQFNSLVICGKIEN